MQCVDCGRLVCPFRGAAGVSGCREGVSNDILNRTYRDAPPNEPRLRGQHEGRDRMVELWMTGKRCP